MDLIQKHHLEKFRFRQPNTRYSIIFQSYYIYHSGYEKKLVIQSQQISDHQDYQEELNLISEIYGKSNPEYVRVKVTKIDKNLNYYHEEEDIVVKYGYLVLDYENKIVIKSFNFPGLQNKRDKLELKDIFFRGKNEVPDDYVWDGNEEYYGWLRYRWGDRQNALDKRSKSSPPKNKTQISNLGEETWIDDVEEKYDALQEKEYKQLKKERW